MKIRKRKKILLGNIKNNRPFIYFVKDVLRKINKTTQKMSENLRTVYWGKNG